VNDEIPLPSADAGRGIVRTGETVRRAPRPCAAFSRALVEALEQRTLSSAPRFFGIDEAGCETLSFIEGEVNRTGAAWSNRQLATAASLIRQLHDCIAAPS
jgi:hypothetical protein